MFHSFECLVYETCAYDEDRVRNISIPGVESLSAIVACIFTKFGARNVIFYRIIYFLVYKITKYFRYVHMQRKHNKDYFLLRYEAIQSSYIINESFRDIDKDVQLYTASYPRRY
jgi:hypothetical protein